MKMLAVCNQCPVQARSPNSPDEAFRDRIAECGVSLHRGATPDAT